MNLKVTRVGQRLSVFILTILMFLDVGPKSSQNVFLETFYWPIGLRMVGCGEVVTNTQEVANCFEELRGQVRTALG